VRGGPIELGYPAVTSAFGWVASRFTGHSGGGVETTMVHASGDLAYTVGFERGPASVDGFPEQEMVIRVTHIYRRFGGEWKLVHRHADGHRWRAGISWLKNASASATACSKAPGSPWRSTAR
jgi:ketosteroid isomerase-like protein